MRPLFSIVIANYNYGQYLEQSILSVIRQSSTDYELIIVDGGSADNSIEVIKRYENHISWWISEKDKGQSDAFNKGFSRANGQFFFWLNADDVLLPDSLKNVSVSIKKNPEYKWFAANSIFFDSNNKILSCKRGPRWVNFLIANAPVYVYGPTTIFHRDLYQSTGGFDTNLHYTMDTDFWMRLANAGAKFKRISRYVWGLRIHTLSKTSHAFTSSPEKAFAEEAAFVLNKNNWKYSKFKTRVQWIYKVISGTYLLSLVDSIRYKGKSIQQY